MLCTYLNTSHHAWERNSNRDARAFCNELCGFVRGVPLSWMQFVHWHHLGISPKWEEERRGGLSVYVYFLYVLNVWS